VNRGFEAGRAAETQAGNGGRKSWPSVAAGKASATQRQGRIERSNCWLGMITQMRIAVNTNRIGSVDSASPASAVVPRFDDQWFDDQWFDGQWFDAERFDAGTA
jgi:hypothetical protein